MILFTIIGKFENDELLTGTINKEAKLSLFYPIVFGIAGIFACVSALIICFTKIIEHKKDKNLVKNITIMIDNKGEAQIQINNKKVWVFGKLIFKTFSKHLLNIYHAFL